MIHEICARDKDWRKIALKISSNKQTADEIVQRMYIKMIKLQPNRFNTSYISKTMYNLYIDMIREDQKKTEFFDKAVDVNYGIDDVELSYINQYQQLPTMQRELIEDSYYSSVRKIGEAKSINYGKVHKLIFNGRKQIISNGKEERKQE